MTDSEPQPSPPTPVVEPLPAPLPPKSAAPEAAPGELLAQPIAPTLAKRYPHLTDYQGHLLLGTADLQVVIAGATPIVDKAVTWQPVVLQAFELRHGAWRLKTALGRVDVAPVGTGAGVPPVAYHAAGIDTGVDKATNGARAGIVLVADEHPKQLVQVRLDGETRTMTITVDDYAVPGKASDRPWKLRLRSTRASDLMGEERTLGGLAGVPYVVRHDGGDVVAVLAFRAVRTDDQWGELILAPDTPRAGANAAPPIEGYEVALSRPAVAKLHERLAAIDVCLYGAKRPKKSLSDAARATWLATCRSDMPTPAATLTLPANDAGGQDAPQPLYVFDENGAALTYNALYAGESLAMTLPAGRRLQFADTRSGRLIDGSVPLDLTVQAPADAATTPFKLALPVRRAHALRLSLAGSDNGAAFVTVTRLDMPRGHALAVGFADDAAAERLGNGLFLVKQWPLKLTLIDGGYQIDVARGGDGTFCTLRLTVGDGRPDRVACPKPTFNTAVAGLADQTTLDAVEVAPTDGAAASAVRTAYGVSYVTAPIAVAAPAAPAPGALPVMRVTDEQSAVTLQLAPADAELVERWAAEPQGEGQERLERFARFARRESPEGWLELSCPIAMPAAEYQHLVGRLDPDAVRILGCWQPEEGDALLTAANATRDGAPLQLTTVSVLHDTTSSAFFPRLVLSKEAGSSPATVAAALKRGDFGVTAGAAITAATLAKAPAPGGTHTVSFDLAATRESRPRYVVLHTEAGRLKRESLAEVGDAPVKMQVSFTPPKGARYLRLEVKGSPRRTSMRRMFDLDEGVVMAASNFLPLNAAQPPKAAP